MSSRIDTVTVATPDQVENRLLWERGRIGAVIMMGGIVVFFVAELVLRPLQRPGISVVQILNFAFLAGCLALGRDPEQRTFNCLLCFAGFTATAVAVAAVGSIARDPTSAMVVLNGMALGTAILIPWGAPCQLAAVAVTLATGMWTYGSTRPLTVELWLQPVGVVLPSLAVSVAVAFLLRRQRLMVADAEHQRRARERSLREANQRLEREIRDHEETEESLRFAMLELDHRVKNSLTTLRSVAELTLETSATPEDFIESFRGRIHAMANIHTGLAATHWEGLDLQELVDLVVGPCRISAGRVSVHGDGVSLTAEQARSVGTALHELATNASKYGALSTADGCVDIAVAVSNTSDRMRLSWKEQGGPRVRPPQRRGLGTRLIENALGYESGGTVELRFDEGGVRCEIDMPLATPPAGGAA